MVDVSWASARGAQLPPRAPRGTLGRGHGGPAAAVPPTRECEARMRGRTTPWAALRFAFFTHAGEHRVPAVAVGLRRDLRRAGARRRVQHLDVEEERVLLAR